MRTETARGSEAKEEGGRELVVVCSDAKEGGKSERRGPRQRDIVQIAESGDIDHRGAAAAEPSGTETTPAPLLRFLTLFPPPSVPCPLLLPTRGNFLPPSLSLLCHFPSQGCSVRSALSRRSDPRVRGILITELRNRRSIGSFVSHPFLSSSLRGRFFFSARTLVCVRLANTAADCVLFFLSRS